MMLFIAGKKMAGWSRVAKESGLVPAAEVVPHAWTHRFLPHEAKRVPGGANAHDKVSLPWLYLVARGSVNFKWGRSSTGVTITEDGARAVRVSTRKRVWLGAVATPQVTLDRHWFEVKIIGSTGCLMIGWSPPGVGLSVGHTSLMNKNKRGCVW